MLACWSIGAAETAPRILVLHSHDSSYVWTRDLTSGFLDRILEEIPDVRVEIEYLDARRVDFSQVRLPFLDFLEAKYSNTLDLIVAFDNDALTFLREVQPQFSDGVPVVFSGINDFRQELLNGVSWVAGIREDLDAEGTIRLAKELDPELKSMLVVTDTNPGGKLVLGEIKDLIAQEDFGLEWGFFTDWTVRELEERLTGLERDTGVLTISISFPRDEPPLPREQAVAFIQSRTASPVFSMLSDQVRAGFVGGSVIDGTEVGHQTGKLAASVLNEQAQPLEIQDISRLLLVNHPALLSADISPDRVPAEATVLNQPVSILDQYRSQIIAVLVFLFVQATVIVLLIHNVRVRRRAEAALWRKANFDDLTDLPNRQQLMDRLSRLFSQSWGELRPGSALLLLDLDNFKRVNDSLGHAAGDVLLNELGHRLHSLADGSGVVARLGGDEFVVLLEECPNLPTAEVFASQVIELLARPVWIQPRELRVTTSVGIVMITETHLKPGDVLRDADLALYQAKAQRGNRYAVFDAQLHTAAVDRLDLERRLGDAIKERSLEPYYQPIIDLENGNIIGFEALARWNDPGYGMVPPDQFVPVAEEAGMIGMLDRLMFEKALSQLSEWSDAIPEAASLRMNINFSYRDLQDSKFIPAIEKILADGSIDPSMIAIEITEQKLVEDFLALRDSMSNLMKLGVRLVIDDFGTGYSSLSYLYNLKVDALKIDRSFISNIQEEGTNQKIVSAIVWLCGQLGIDVIAEGIETEAQALQIRELGCKIGQGYLFSRPLASDAATVYIKLHAQ